MPNLATEADQAHAGPMSSDTTPAAAPPQPQNGPSGDGDGDGDDDGDDVKIPLSYVIKPSEEELGYLKTYACLNPDPDKLCRNYVLKRLVSADYDFQIQWWFQCYEARVSARVRHVAEPLREAMKDGYRRLVVSSLFYGPKKGKTETSFSSGCKRGDGGGGGAGGKQI